MAVEAKAVEAMAVVARLMEVVMVVKGVVVTVVTREEAAKGRRRRRRWLRLKREGVLWTTAKAAREGAQQAR